jgi:hypothetical protein
MLLCFNLTGCFGKKYTIDYCGLKDMYKNAKDSYRAGQTVRFWFPYVASDTDYTFYMNGERFNDFEYDPMKGFVFEFTMPDHDIVLEVDSRNSMMAVYAE